MSLNLDALMEVIRLRRSMGLSRLSDRPVPRECIEVMLEAANWAPSHRDTEPWRFQVFMGDGRAQLAEHYAAAHLADHPDQDPESAHKRAWAAPVWIAIGLVPGFNEDGERAVPRDEEVMAVSGAVLNLHLAARAQGLAGMWHSKGLSVHPVVRERLGWNDPAELLGFFMLGWPEGEWLEGERGPWTDKVSWVEHLTG